MLEVEGINIFDVSPLPIKRLCGMMSFFLLRTTEADCLIWELERAGEKNLHILSLVYKVVAQFRIGDFNFIFLGLCI